MNAETIALATLLTVGAMYFATRKPKPTVSTVNKA